jgi:hypothetical protein
MNFELHHQHGLTIARLGNKVDTGGTVQNMNKRYSGTLFCFSFYWTLEWYLLCTYPHMMSIPFPVADAHASLFTTLSSMVPNWEKNNFSDLINIWLTYFSCVMEIKMYPKRYECPVCEGMKFVVCSDRNDSFQTRYMYTWWKVIIVFDRARFERSKPTPEKGLLPTHFGCMSFPNQRPWWN